MLKKGTRLSLRAVALFYRERGSAWLMLRMTLWVAMLSFSVRRMSLPRALRLIRPGTRRAHDVARPAEVGARLAQALDTLLNTNFLFLTPTCWKRAPVLHRYLLLHGIETQIVFGVRQASENLLAGHAWLEQDGRPILEVNAPDYRKTFSFPA